MASEIQLQFITGRTVFAVIRNAAAQVWSTVASAFVSYVSADFANYDIALTEQDTSGYYVGNLPAAIVSAGTEVTFVLYDRLTGSPLENDPVVGIGSWSAGLSLAPVDGLTYNDYMEALIATILGETVLSGNTVQFMKRDGSTVKVTITYGGPATRLTSVIS